MCFLLRAKPLFLALGLMETLILGNFMCFPRLGGREYMKYKQHAHLLERPKISL